MYWGHWLKGEVSVNFFLAAANSFISRLYPRTWKVYRGKRLDISVTFSNNVPQKMLFRTMLAAAMSPY